MSRARRAWHLSLLVALVSSALAIYLYFRGPARPAAVSVPTSSEAPVHPARARFKTWFEEYEPRWRQNEFVSLHDRPKLTGVLRDAVRARRGVAELNEVELVACVSDFLWALAASSPGEYFTRVGTTRIAGADEFNARFAHIRYRHLIGEALVPDFDVRGVFQRLWAFDTQGVGRPAKVAANAVICVGTSVAIDLVRIPREQRLLAFIEPREMQGLLNPETELPYWLDSVSTGGTALTQPTRSLLSVLRERAQTALANCFMITETTVGDVFPIIVTLYVDPAGQWHVEGLCSSSIKDLAWPY